MLVNADANVSADAHAKDICARYKTQNVQVGFRHRQVALAVWELAIAFCSVDVGFGSFSVLFADK